MTEAHRRLPEAVQIPLGATHFISEGAHFRGQNQNGVYVPMVSEGLGFLRLARVSRRRFPDGTNPPGWFVISGFNARIIGSHREDPYHIPSSYGEGISIIYTQQDHVDALEK